MMTNKRARCSARDAVASQRGPSAAAGRKRAFDALDLVTPPPNARAAPGGGAMIGKVAIAALVDDTEMDQAAREHFDESVIALVRHSHTAARAAAASAVATVPSTGVGELSSAGPYSPYPNSMRMSIASTVVRSDAPLFGDAMALFDGDDLFVKTPRGAAIAAAAAETSSSATTATNAVMAAAPSLISPDMLPTTAAAAGAAAVSTLRAESVPLQRLLTRAQYFRKRHVDALIQYIGNYRARVEREQADAPPPPPPPKPKKARLAPHVAKTQRTQLADADALENLAFQPPPPMQVDHSVHAATPWSAASTSTATADYVPKKLRF